MGKGYLPHLDGLRAIAVGLVVLYHAGFNGISAGYVGVDVFFVLSGFLITGQLVKNLDSDDFSFAQFYVRRIRRLVPAFVVVAIATLAAGAFMLLPDDLVYLSRLTALAMLSVGNFYLANTTDGYFEAETEEIAMLHTWSLAVEEQFYLLWPLLLCLLWKYVPASRRLGAVCVLFLASVLFSGWYTQTDALRAYYLLPARFHELLLGALLAMAAWKYALLRPTRPVRELLCWSGLLLVILPAFIWNAGSAFPGYSALLPCTGTAILIYAGHGNSSANWLLTRPMMVWLGMLSYSLYLWHWPIFSFARYATGGLSTPLAVSGIVLAVLLSYLTWRFVEKPFRFQWRGTARKTVAVLLVAPTLAMAATAAVIYNGDGFIHRFDTDSVTKIRAMQSTPSQFPLSCPDNPDAPCADILLAGDSHAEHYGDFISVLASDARLDFNVMTRPGCPLYPGLTPIIKNDEEPEIDSECPTWNHEVLTQTHRYRYVLLAGYWSVSDTKGDRYFFVRDDHTKTSKAHSAANIRHALRAAIRHIAASGAIPVLLYDNPVASDEDFKCSRMNLMPFHDEKCAFPRHVMDQQQQLKRQFFAELDAEFSMLRFIDPTDVLCDSVQCYTEVDGVPLYRDDDHLNRAGSTWLGQQYLEEFGNPFHAGQLSANKREWSNEG